jgi:hypothetical protein
VTSRDGHLIADCCDCAVAAMFNLNVRLLLSFCLFLLGFSPPLAQYLLMVSVLLWQ